MGHHLDAVLKRGFRAAKCLTFLKLTVARIKVSRNQKHVAAQKLRNEIAQLLRSGQDSHAYRLKADSLITILNTVKAYDLIEQYCNLVKSRLPILEIQRYCPPDLKEAVASLIFAAPRCADLHDLARVREMFSSKYGKEFVTAVTELRPDCGVNKQIIDLLSMRPPSGQTRVKLMKEIAAESKIDWKGENELTDPPAARPGRSDKQSPQADSKTDGPSTIGTAQSASISRKTNDRNDSAAVASGNTVAPVIAVSSLGVQSTPVDTPITSADSIAESGRENASQSLELLSSSLSSGQTQTVGVSSKAMEVAESGVHDEAEVSDPESIEGAELEFLDAVETMVADSSIDVTEPKIDIEELEEESVVADSIGVVESKKMHIEVVAAESVVADSIDVVKSKNVETVVADSINVVESKKVHIEEVGAESVVADSMDAVESKNVDIEEVAAGESVVALDDELRINRHALEGASDTKCESDSQEDTTSNVGVEFPPRTEFGSSKLNEASLLRPQKNLVESDFRGSGKGMHYKDLESAAQAAFESAAQAAEAAQAAFELARYYRQEPGHTTKAASPQVPQTRQDSGSKLSFSNVSLKHVTEERKGRAEMESTSEDSVPANLDRSRTATSTGAEQARDPNDRGSSSSTDDDGHVVGELNMRWNSKRVSQKKTSPEKARISHHDSEQLFTIDSEGKYDDMTNPVSLWNRKVIGAHIRNEPESTQVQKPMFDDDIGDSSDYGFGDDFGSGAFPAWRNDSLDKNNSGWGSGQVSGSSSQLTSKSSTRNNHSPLFDEASEGYVGGQSRFDRTGLREELADALVGIDDSSHKPKFDEEENEGRLPPGAIAWGQKREKAPAPVSDFGRRTEGQLRWGSSSSSLSDDGHEQTKGGGHVESRRTQRHQRKPAVSPPVEKEQQKEAGGTSWFSLKTEADVDENDRKKDGQFDNRRPQREQGRSTSSVREEEQVGLPASNFGKSAWHLDEFEPKNAGRAEERRRTQREHRRPISSVWEEEQEVPSSTVVAALGNSTWNKDDAELKKAGRVEEKQRTHREQRRPTSSVYEEENEAPLASEAATVGKNASNVEGVEMKKKVGLPEESRRTEEHMIPKPLVWKKEEDVPSGTSGKSTYIFDEVEPQKKVEREENRRSPITQPKLPVDSPLPEAASVSFTKNDAGVMNVDTASHRSSSRKKVLDQKAAEDPDPPFKVKDGDVVASKPSLAIKTGGSFSAAAAIFPSPVSPPRRSPLPPLPQSPLPSSSSDPAGLTAATPSRADAPSPSRASTSASPTASASPPAPKLASTTSVPSPTTVKPSAYGGRAHPKLPDYESLTAQFQKLREEKAAGRPS